MLSVNMKKIIKKIHNKFIYSGRVENLSKILLPLLKHSKNVLDVGCGDGLIDSNIMKKNKNIKIDGIDVLLRSHSYINVTKYNGTKIPYKDSSFDTVMVIDVLHHTKSIDSIMAELTRVSSKYIIIKDHIKTGLLSYLKLRLMDYVGNSYLDINLPYNYLTKEEWKKLFADNNLNIIKIKSDIKLYGGRFGAIFNNNLHFIALLEKNNNSKS